MNPPTIPDLFAVGETVQSPTSKSIRHGVAEPFIAEINARHRERMAEVIAERDEARQEREQARDAVMEAAAEIERLKLDVGILNGRLIERTETMLARQRESLDAARKAHSVARRAIDQLVHIMEVFREAANDGRVHPNNRVSYGSAATRLEKAVTNLRADLTAAKSGQSADKPADATNPEPA